MSGHDKVICKCCGGDFIRITNTHLANCSGLTIAEYKLQFPGASIESKSLAMSRVNHLRDLTYEEVYGEEKATSMKESRSKSTFTDWENNPERIRIRELAELKMQEKLMSPTWIGHRRDPVNFGNGICENCGVEFEYRKSDSIGKFCSRDCSIAQSRRESSNYRIKAFAHYEPICDICGDSESKLLVHHRNKNQLDDSVENLQIVCNKCHVDLHTEDRKSRGQLSQAAIARGFVEILKGLKVDIRDENFKDTPRRFAKAYAEIFEGLLPSATEELEKHLSVTFPCEYDEMIIVSDIQCWSMCPHHFLPVKYKVDIGYIPNGKVLGISKLPRLVELLAKRPVLQEQFTKDIVDFFEKYAAPAGVIVKASGEHLCMQMRGVKAVGSVTMTAEVSGIFKTDASAKSEFYSLIRKG